MRMVYLWSVKTPLGKMKEEMEVAAQTAVDWYNFIRDVCAQYFIDHPAIIGGPGVEVEIDESKFGKRKYNRCRQVEGHWVFGGTERITGECFLVEVDRRDAATLLPLIQQHIRRGSIIYSDEWKAYSRITATTGMSHETVNHSLHFVDPATGAHTQGVEAMWSSWNLVYKRDLCTVLSDVESTVHWCQRHKLLAERKSCPKCGREMHLVKRKAVRSKLGIEKIMRMVYLWSVKTPLGKMKEEMEVAAQTAVDWYNFIRDVCAQYFIDHPAIIGGPGVEVEIDESKFGKRKYNRGRQVEGHWVFGGTERITGECFLVEVDRRDAATLLPLIQQHIRRGSIIYSDEWKAYSRITATTGMSHETVNHSLHFVDPATGAHT
eukprot:Em0013g981a